MKYLYLQRKLREKDIRIFSRRDFKLLLGLSEKTASQLLWRYNKQGIVVKLRQDLYALKQNMPPAYVIANRLYQPSYISFDAALSFHGIIPETIYTITSAAAKTTRRFTAAGILYSYQQIKRSVFTGYIPLKYQGFIVLMAEAEKALADLLYFVDIKKRQWHYERLNLKKIKKAKLIKYLKLFRRPAMLALMEEIYAEARKPARIY